LLGLLVTSAVLVLTNGWRLSIVTLGVQYLLAATVLAQTADGQVVVAKALVGLLIVGSLTVTGRTVNFGRRSAAEAEALPPRLAALRALEFPTNFPFRLIAVLLVAVAVWYMVTEGNYTFPGVPVSISLAGYLLMALGLLNLGLTEEPMNAGMGLLTLMTGFDVIYASVEPSRAVVALVAAMHFGVTLGVSYLAVLRYAEAGE
jgi:hypothetical protein